MPADLPVPWTVFADFQERDQSWSIDRSLAREEALDEILDEIKNDPSLPEQEIRNRFKTLSQNRHTKLRRRRGLEYNRSRPDRRHNGNSFSESSCWLRAATFDQQVALAELLILVRSVLTDADFRLLCDIADGTSYTEAALARAVSAAAVKAQVFRARKRVRTSHVGRTLRAALVCINSPRVGRRSG